MMTDREYELTQMQARACIQGLYRYAGYLAAAGQGQFRLPQLMSMVEQLYCWYGLGPDLKQENEAERLKCMEPIERLIRGEQLSLGEFAEAHQAAIANCLRTYREELVMEVEPVYEPDIHLCDELIRETSALLKNDESQLLHPNM